MIEKMSKVLFVGPHEKKEELIKSLQKMGVLEIKPHESDLKGLEINRSSADHIRDTYIFLKEYKHLADESTLSTTYDDELECDKLCGSLQSYKKQIFQLLTEEQSIRSEMERIRIWGYFDIHTIKEMRERGKTYLQFWETSQRTQFDDCQIPDEIIVEDIANIGERKYFITFFFMPIKLEHCEEMVIEEDMSMLKKKLDENLEAQKNLEKAVIQFIPLLERIHDIYQRELDRIAYEEALASSGEALYGKLFTLQGWCPTLRFNTLKTTLDDICVEVQEIEPEENERIPTLMSNGKIGDMGADLVNMYDTPAYKDWDPSSWVFFSFAIFFAMIMADGGYGLILLAIMLVTKVKMKNPLPAVNRFINLSIILSSATVVYGLITGGFLGLSSENKLFGWLVGKRLFDPLDIDMMMNASIIIGMIHISISLFLKAMRQIKVFMDKITPVSYLAWISAIWSFYFWYGYGRLEGHPFFESKNLILSVFVASLTLIFFFTAGTFKPAKLIFGGLGGLYNGVQFFSDVLSYLRLFALGMAGTLLAQTFNNLAVDVAGLGFGGVLFGCIIFIVGHIINLVLCIMGGVIHGLRLNFLEWYRWSFDGDGKTFKPFKMLSQKPGMDGAMFQLD